MYTSQVIVQYVVSREEYVESHRLYRLRMARSRLFFRNLFALSAVAAVLGLFVRLSGYAGWGDVLFLTAGALLLEHTLLWRLRAGSAYSSNTEDREPIELKIEESNLVRTCRAGSAEIRWANIASCHETKKLFVLQAGTNDRLAIPKRAFSPGDLFRFQELLKKELIVKTTRDNPDAVLLRFVVSWSLISITAIFLFIGYLDNFLSDLPKPATGIASTPDRTDKPRPRPPTASLASLSGLGTVYLVPVGTVKSAQLPQLLEDIRGQYRTPMALLPQISPPDWTKNPARKQSVAEDLLEAVKFAYPKLAADPQAILIGITDEDMYISGLRWKSAFSFRDDDRFAVVSTSHLSDGDDEDEDNKPVSQEAMQKRLRKALVRDIGFLHYRLQPSASYDSILYENVEDPPDLDGIGDGYLESDAKVRAQLHVEKGDPCFIVRHYIAPERERPGFGTVSGCSGFYKELGLETVQIDLRYGLMLDQRTDFFTPGTIPLDLTRVVRTQDSTSRAFGIGGNHSLNIFLVGNKWPFTWMDLISDNGGRSHFRRSNWGWGYLDARYTNRDASRTAYSSSTINWAWPGWKLQNQGLTYLFPDPNGASRPELGALISIEAFDKSLLSLRRDTMGNLLLAHSSTGDELAFKYDSSSRVTEVSPQNGGRFVYSYNTTGRLDRVTDADRRVTEYGYDWAGRMNRIVQDGKVVSTLEYDSGGRVKSQTLGDGRTYLFHYELDDHQNVLRVDISDSAGPTRRIRISAGEYVAEALAKGER